MLSLAKTLQGIGKPFDNKISAFVTAVIIHFRLQDLCFDKQLD